MVRGVPCMCISTRPQPRSATRGSIAGSAAAADVVDGVGAGVEGGAGCRRAVVSTVRGRSVRRPQGREHRQQAVLLGSGPTRSAPGRETLGAQVQQIGAFVGQAQGGVHGGLGAPAAAGPRAGPEAVRRQVDDAHDQRAPGRSEAAAAEPPARCCESGLPRPSRLGAGGTLKPGPPDSWGVSAAVVGRGSGRLLARRMVHLQLHHGQGLAGHQQLELLGVEGLALEQGGGHGLDLPRGARPGSGGPAPAARRRCA